LREAEAGDENAVDAHAEREERGGVGRELGGVGEDDDAEEGADNAGGKGHADDDNGGVGAGDRDGVFPEDGENDGDGDAKEGADDGDGAIGEAEASDDKHVQKRQNGGGVVGAADERGDAVALGEAGAENGGLRPERVDQRERGETEQKERGANRPSLTGRRVVVRHQMRDAHRGGGRERRGIGFAHQRRRRGESVGLVVAVKVDADVLVVVQLAADRVDVALGPVVRRQRQEPAAFRQRKRGKVHAVKRRRRRRGERGAAQRRQGGARARL
jgi:hypothetical protein